MTEIKQEPLDEDEEVIEEPNELVEVKDPIEVKLEVKLEGQIRESGGQDFDLDSIGVRSDEEGKDIEDDKEDDDIEEDDGPISDDSDEDYEVDDLDEENDDPLTGTDQKDDTEDEDVNVEEIPEEDDDDIEDDDKNGEEKSIELAGMTIIQKGQYSKCPKCEKWIKSTFILRHIKAHAYVSEKVTCPEGCGMTFGKINNMFRHLINVHQSKEPYVCKHCGNRFAKSKALTSHLAKHRADKRSAQLDSEENDNQDTGNGNKNFACEFPGCDKSYGKKHHLKEHERKHTGERNYVCQVCNKRFFAHAHMKRHMYSHTGLKPHICRWKCGATFASYGGRMKHERINHYKRNPLEVKCDICERPLKNQQQLIKHRMTHLNPAERME